MQVTPFTLLRTSDMAACRERSSQLVHQWAQAWLPSTTILPEVGCTEASDPSLASPQGRWLRCVPETRGVAWCYVAQGFANQVQNALFAVEPTLRNTESRPSTLAMSAATSALEDLIAMLLSQFGLHVGSSDGEVAPTWMLRNQSGSALIKVVIGGEVLLLVIPAPALPSRLRPQPRYSTAPVVPLTTALSDTSIRVSARLGEAEMSLGHFASLAIGDVIRLPVTLDEPLSVVGEDGKKICSAHLGRQGTHRALEIFQNQQAHLTKN